jgi:5-methylcytosine-specific restriction enzyme A
MGLNTRKEHHRHSKKVTRTARWKVLRMAILERDGFRCRDCGCGGRLEVDHIQPVRSHPQLSFEPGNLQALCPACHTKKTRIECGHKPLPDDRRDWRNAVDALSGTGKKPKLSIIGE